MELKYALTHSIYKRGVLWESKYVPPAPPNLTAGQMKLWNFLSSPNKLSDNENKELIEAVYQATGLRPVQRPSEYVQVPYGVVFYVQGKNEPVLSIPKGGAINAGGNKVYNSAEFDLRQIKLATWEEVEWFVNAYSKIEHLVMALDLIPDHAHYVQDVTYERALEATNTYFGGVPTFPPVFEFIRREIGWSDAVRMVKEYPESFNFSSNDLSRYLYPANEMVSIPKYTVAECNEQNIIIMNGMKYFSPTSQLTSEMSAGAIYQLRCPSTDAIYDTVMATPPAWFIEKEEAEIFLKEDEAYEKYYANW